MYVRGFLLRSGCMRKREKETRKCILVLASVLDFLRGFLLHYCLGGEEMIVLLLVLLLYIGKRKKVAMRTIVMVTYSVDYQGVVHLARPTFVAPSLSLQ